MKYQILSLLALCAGSLGAWGETIELGDLDLTKITCFDDAGKTKVRKNQNTMGGDLVMKGVTYTTGVGTHAPSKAIIELNGATDFHAILGVTDSADEKPNHGVVDYTVTLYKDKEAEVICTGTLTREGTDVYDLNVLTTGYDYLVLEYATGAQAWADHCAWADAVFTYADAAPLTVTEEEMYPTEIPPVEEIIQLPAEGADGAEIVPLSGLQLSNVVNGWGTVHKDASIEGNPISINGVKYASGIGMHAPGMIVVKLNGAATKFHCEIGIDDEMKNAPANAAICDYRVYLRSVSGAITEVSAGTIQKNQAAVPVQIDDLNGFKYLVIEITNGAGGNASDHVDIANGYFEYVEQNSNRPEIVAATVLESGLDAPVTMFSLPGVRYMHRLRSTNPDAEITVKDLPAGLTFNPQRTLVDGRIEVEGVYHYTVVVSSGDEQQENEVTLTVSKNLEQPTPFMGWLSWNVVQGDVSEEIVKQVADAFVDEGFYDAGYRYVMMDDLWHADTRAADGKPQANPTRFPNGVKVCADYVHERGLKFGLYSDAAAKTCAGAFGGFGSETIDANTYAEWGVDILKYDYCGAPADVATAKVRYKTMGDALKASGRNIILFVCEWGVRDPWKWGAEVGSSAWRTMQDGRDCWVGSGNGVGITQAVAGMKDLWVYNGVNRFNDADMLCTGLNGTGKSSSHLCATGPGMTKDEYRTQFALWCMWSSPLALSFDIRQPISAVDKKIMLNKEIIALDQDPMGQAAETVSFDDGMFLLSKDLENGDVAISVTNMNDAAQSFTFDFSKIPALDAQQTYTVRDLQKQEDCDDATGSIASVNVKSHATAIYRLSPKAATVEPDPIEDGLTELGAAKAARAYDLQGRPATSASHGIVVTTTGQKLRK